MNIYLEWTPPYISNKGNISIFDLEISQKENCFAKARLVIEAAISFPHTGTEAVIRGANTEIFFKGLLVGTPVKIEGDLAEMELVARPLDFSEKMGILQKESRIPPYWDSLWVPSEKHTDPQEIQDVRTSSLYCDRRTGELAQSDWFEGKQVIAVHQNFFFDSLQIKCVRSPLKACTVNVHAHWIQSESGISNLSSHIRRAFPLFKMSTYTKNAILEKWPEPRKRLGRSGLWVVKSELKPMAPPSPLYPNYSPPVSLAEEGKPFKTYRVKRHWFKPVLWLGWEVQQRRKETLSLTLFHAFQPIFPGEGDHKTLEFALQNINPDPNVYAWRAESFIGRERRFPIKMGYINLKPPIHLDLPLMKIKNFGLFNNFFIRL